MYTHTYKTSVIVDLEKTTGSVTGETGEQSLVGPEESLKVFEDKKFESDLCHGRMPGADEIGNIF